MSATPEILRFLFADAGEIPNHPRLPVVIYKRALHADTADALAKLIETRWREHGWSPAWRWGVYDFPHYHSTAHEILGVYRGNATLRLGHTSGITAHVEPGDIVVLPAGTGHQNLGSSEDFHVVGGYPAGQDADLLRGRRGERPAADERIARVPLPKQDPLFGTAGPLTELWQLGSPAGAAK